MRLALVRKWFTEKTTIGSLYVNGRFECYVLEDRYRPPPEPKVFGQTCIPCGEYVVKITPSPRFKRDLPLVLNVPGFEGIRIHTGNKAEDTEGCLLPGLRRGVDEVRESKLAFDSLFEKLRLAESRSQTITLNISLGSPP